MRVELINFRSYVDKTFEFEPNMLTLIAGPSGVGKSTILEAIRWCITGKIQRIAPHDNPKGKTSVRVTFPDGTIYYRLNSPKRFEVTKPSSDEKLDEIDLNESYWNATTYLKQLEFHPLLNSTEAEKLELITILALQRNDPSARIEELKSIMGSYNAKISKQQAVLTNLRRQLTKELTINNLTEQDLEFKPMITIKGEEIDDPIILIERIEEFERRKTELHSQLVEYQVNEKRKNELVKGINKTKEEINEEIIKLTNEIDIHYVQLNIINIKKERDTINRKLINLKKGYSAPKEILPAKGWEINEINLATEMISKYTINANVCKKYKIAYDQPIIEERVNTIQIEIDKLNQQIDVQRQLVLLQDQYNEYQRIKREADMLRNQLLVSNDKINGLIEITSVEADIKLIEDELITIEHHRADEYYEAERELQQAILTCPHCSGHLKYQRNNLIKVDHYDPQTARELIDEINIERLNKKNELNIVYQGLLVQRKEFNTYKTLKKKYEQEIYRIKTQLTSAENSLASFKSIPSQPTDLVDFDMMGIATRIKSLMAEQSALSNVKFYTLPPITPEKMRHDNDLIELYERKAKIDELTEQLNMLIIPDELPNLSYPTIEATRAAINKLENNLRNLNEADNIILSANPIKTYEQTSKAIIQLRCSLDEMNTINRLIVFQSEILQMDEEISILSDELETISNLLSKMEEARYASLIVIVNMLNKRVNKYLRQLFVDSITFRLDMFRENKTGKKDIKPKVNVNINYKGYDVDLRSLSPGEYTRVSMSILLSLAKINKSPLIMMDETLSSLEQEDLKRTINVIKHYNRKHTRTILFIDHHETTGWYDDLKVL